MSDAAGWIAARLVDGWPAATRAAELLAGGTRVGVGGLWGSAQALFCSALPPATGPRLVVLSSDAEAEGFVADLALTPARDVVLFPSREGQGVGTTRARLELAQRLTDPSAGRPAWIVTSILGLLEAIPSVKDLEREFLRLTVGEVLDPEHLLRRLTAAGYTRQPLAEAPGEVSLRGDILDLFPLASEEPLRIELFEDEIESLRTFDPVDQRSIESHEAVEVCLASDGEVGAEGAHLWELLPRDTTLVEVEPLRVDERAESLRIRSPLHERALRRLAEWRADAPTLRLQSLPAEGIQVDTRSVQGLEVGLSRAPEALTEAARSSAVLVLCPSPAQAARMEKSLHEAPGTAEVTVAEGTLTRGFRCPELGLTVVNLRELEGIRGLRQRASRQTTHRTRALQSFFELKPGDLVVHAVHGLARYRGLERLERGGGEEEHLHLAFADDVSLYVPASRIDLVQRYIGSGSGSGVPLDRIGGSTFRKRKERVERGLYDLAAELIEVQARRQTHEREPWAVDAGMVRELIEAFPHEDTVDQATVDVEIEGDLTGPRPMDRLLCGDVGFGKTELAVRAALRVVSAGGQVAVLVPTTVLAAQHHETFRERLAGLPVEVAVISRYVGTRDTREVLERTARGEVDVLIGTHRLLSKDVSFPRLGLLIIDEEQRFGVTHKEHFKRLRATVDVLALTATPIPRTLHMSLSGIRDISALTVPPAGRQDVETRIAYTEDDDTIAAAIRAEHARGGQVYFLHNRVSSIEATARRLQRLVPECTYVVGHGQMPGRELRVVMDTFMRGDADVLVATTIIENGIDVPSAGTILIDEADRFGLSELHQLRGRVGRAAQKCHCYLLVDRTKPLKDIARERLKALEELSHLGAGFGISVKDLELRGAGNILGAQQSGHIAAVGYDMYCRLLRLTIDRLQAGEGPEAPLERLEEHSAGAELELGLRAFLPESWIPDPDLRLEVLRELAQIAGDEEADAAQAMLRDRFGRPPAEAEELLRQFRLKARLDPFRITRLAWRDDRYLVEYQDPVLLEALFGPLDVDLRRIRRGVAHLVVPLHAASPAAALAWLEDLLVRAAPVG